MRLVFVGKGVYLEINTDLLINLDHGLSNIPRRQHCGEGGQGLCGREENGQSCVEVEGLCRRKAKVRDAPLSKKCSFFEHCSKGL